MVCNYCANMRAMSQFMSLIRDKGLSNVSEYIFSPYFITKSKQTHSEQSKQFLAALNVSIVLAVQLKVKQCSDI